MKILISIAVTIIGSFTLNGIYNYSVSSIDNTTIHFNSFAGKKILVVNTACNSKDTAQLTELEQLHQLYHDSLIILAVPSNSFYNEFSTADSIKQFLRNRYGAHYTITSPQFVKGPMPAFFQWLTQSSKNRVLDAPVANDFQKFLINENGVLVGIFAPSVTPMSSKIQNAITTDWP
jgi:glutathione peroxidase